jgi:hypothetical protein
MNGGDLVFSLSIAFAIGLLADVVFNKKYK